MNAKTLYRLSNRHNRINSNWDEMRMEVPTQVIEEDNRIVKVLKRFTNRIDEMESRLITSFVNYNKDSKRVTMHSAISNRESNTFSVKNYDWFSVKPSHIFQS